MPANPSFSIGATSVSPDPVSPGATAAITTSVAATLTIQNASAVVAFSVGSITASPTSLAPGQATTISAQVTNTGNATATGINVLLELKDPLGKAFPGNQQGMGGQTFGPGETKTYSFTWASTAGSPQGTYSASIGAFDLSWSTLYAWKTNARAYTVGAAAKPTFTVGPTTAAPASVAHGQSLSVTTTVSDTSSQPAANVIVDVEVKDAAGNKLLQQYAQGQVFSAGQSRQLVFVFPIPATMPTGTYYVDIAVFDGTWSTLYAYAWHSASFAVTP